eukprot:8725709-Pyramimonas_sp.AAC.1
MEIEGVEELSTAELARYGQALDAHPRHPRLRRSKEGGLCAYTCSRRAARHAGIDEREAVAKAARTYRGAGSIQHSRDRVAKIQESFNVLQDSLDVLVGHALSEDGELALRRATTGARIDKSSTGAPPATEEVAKEVG